MQAMGKPKTSAENKREDQSHRVRGGGGTRNGSCKQ